MGYFVCVWLVCILLVTWYRSFIISSQCECINLFGFRSVFITWNALCFPSPLRLLSLVLSYFWSRWATFAHNYTQYSILICCCFFLSPVRFIPHSITNKVYLLRIICIYTSFHRPLHFFFFIHSFIYSSTNNGIMLEFVAHHKIQVLTKWIPPDLIYKRTKTETFWLC